MLCYFTIQYNGYVILMTKYFINIYFLFLFLFLFLLIYILILIKNKKKIKNSLG